MRCLYLSWWLAICARCDVPFLHPRTARLPRLGLSLCRFVFPWAPSYCSVRPGDVSCPPARVLTSWACPVCLVLFIVSSSFLCLIEWLTPMFLAILVLLMFPSVSLCTSPLFLAFPSPSAVPLCGSSPARIPDDGGSPPPGTRACLPVYANHFSRTFTAILVCSPCMACRRVHRTFPCRTHAGVGFVELRRHEMECKGVLCSVGGY